MTELPVASIDLDSEIHDRYIVTYPREWAGIRDSIASLGRIIQPPVLLSTDDKKGYRIVCGYKRVKAAIEKSPVTFVFAEETVDGRVAINIEEMASLKLKGPVVLIPTVRGDPEPSIGWPRLEEILGGLGLKFATLGGEAASACVEEAAYRMGRFDPRVDSPISFDEGSRQDKKAMMSAVPDYVNLVYLDFPHGGRKAFLAFMEKLDLREGADFVDKGELGIKLDFSHMISALRENRALKWNLSY